MTTLVRRTSNPVANFPSLFDDFFTRDLFNFGNQDRSYNDTLPSVNIRETDDKFVVEVAAPGMNRNDFKVELDNDTLVISAFREEKNEEKDEDGNFNRREFHYQNFRRSFTLPERMVKGDKITAKYRDGILEIMVPKTDEAKTKPVRHIQIS